MAEERRQHRQSGPDVDAVAVPAEQGGDGQAVGSHAAEPGTIRSGCQLYALATTLTDVERYPAIELARLYHDRWQAETGIGDLKTAIRGGPEVVLRSKSPAMVEQEFWALLCVYQAIRELISYAAPTGLDPGRVSFKRAFEAARDSVTRAALSPLPD